MGTSAPRLGKDTFERLREQLAVASALCSEDQLLDLADGLHDAIRRRRARRDADVPQSGRRKKGREPPRLSAGWPRWLTAASLDPPLLRT